MPVLLLVTRSESLPEEISAALAEGPAETGMLVPCPTMEQANEIQASLSDEVLWLLDTETTQGALPPEKQPCLLIHSATESVFPPDLPTLERPIRPRELYTLTSFLLAGSASSDAEFTRPGMERFVHDLNNRLTTVSGYLSILPELLEDEDEMLEDMDRAMREAESLIEDLLQKGAPSNHQK